MTSVMILETSFTFINDVHNTGNTCNDGIACFKKCSQMFEYQNVPYLETSGGQSSNLYLNVVH